MGEFRRDTQLTHGVNFPTRVNGAADQRGFTSGAKRQAGHRGPPRKARIAVGDYDRAGQQGDQTPGDSKPSRWRVKLAWGTSIE